MVAVDHGEVRNMVTVTSNVVRCWRLDTVTGGCNYGGGGPGYQLLYQGHYVSSDGPPPAALTVPSTLGHHRNYAGTGTNITRLGLKMVRRKCRLHLNVQIR